MIKKINFYLPDFYNNYTVNFNLINLINQYPEKFYNNFTIKGFFGSFPCIWNGHYQYINNYNDFHNIDLTISNLNNLNYSLNYTFLNDLQKKHFFDRVGNCILTLSNNIFNNGVIIANNNFKKYIKNNYKNIIIYNYLPILKNNYKYNSKEKYIISEKQINNFDNKNKNNIIVEIKCNTCTNQKCIKNQQKKINKQQMLFINQNIQNCNNCNNNKIFYFNIKHKIKFFIEKKYHNFLITTNNLSKTNLINIYLELFVKPEFHLEIRYILEERGYIINENN